MTIKTNFITYAPCITKLGAQVRLTPASYGLALTFESPQGVPEYIHA